LNCDFYKLGGGMEKSFSLNYFFISQKFGHKQGEKEKRIVQLQHERNG
jgi:hypothetical protein